MRTFSKILTPELVNSIIGGELLLKQPTELRSIADPREADAGSVIFLDNEKFLPLVEESAAGLIVAGNRFRKELEQHPANIIFVEKAYQSVLLLIHFWLESEKEEFVGEIHPTAVIGRNVVLPEKVRIGAYCIISDNVRIGENTEIYPFCQIGSDSIIGSHSVLYSHVTLYPETVVGENVRIHAGCVIGADGFGYILMNGIQQKIPQIGNVVIHNHVEIGANTTIDKGTIGPTIIGEGTKIDNLVQIGHNCVIGKHCILCAQVGLAGSSVLGDYVYLAGQVGLAGHLNIGDGVMVGAQSGVSSDLEAGGKYFGYPARNAMLMKRVMAVENNLPDMYRFIQKLKKERGQE